MSMWTAKEKSLSYDQAKEDAARAHKDIKMVNKHFISAHMYLKGASIAEFTWSLRPACTW